MSLLGWLGLVKDCPRCDGNGWVLGFYGEYVVDCPMCKGGPDERKEFYQKQRDLDRADMLNARRTRKPKSDKGV